VTTGASTAGFEPVNRVAKVRCLADISVVHLPTLGRDAAGRVILGIEAGADAVGDIGALSRDSANGRGYDQGDGSNVGFCTFFFFWKCY